MMKTERSALSSKITWGNPFLVFLRNSPVLEAKDGSFFGSDVTVHRDKLNVSKY
jgi:hypothetical protein